MSNIEVVGLGALNLDYLYRVERILDDGEGIVKEATLSPGGSAANTIYGLAKLGMSTSFVGAIGDDDDGKILLSSFQRVGVDISRIKIKPGTRTGSVICLTDSLGKRSLYVLPGANSLLAMADLDLDYINRARVLHLSSFADDRQFKMSLKLLKKLDLSVKISFSPGALYAAKGLKALAPLLARTHVLFINQNEIQQLTGEDVVAGAGICIQQGCRIVAVTLGKGIKLKPGKETAHRAVTAASYIRDAKNEYVVEPLSQNAVTVDTTGAGDAFATGFLFGLLNNKGLDTCGQLGSVIARFSITRIGARDGLPTLDELSQRYRELYGKGL